MKYQTPSDLFNFLIIGVDFIRHCLTKCVKKTLYQASTLGPARNSCVIDFKDIMYDVVAGREFRI